MESHLVYLHYFFFFFNDTATTEIYTLSLHDALPICRTAPGARSRAGVWPRAGPERLPADRDRKSTRLNSSHANISYAVFCLKKKKKKKLNPRRLMRIHETTQRSTPLIKTHKWIKSHT